MEHDTYLFERLDVWQAASQALVAVVGLRERLRLPGDMRSQIERALASCVANIAEGVGRESSADRKRHFAIARGSATEAGGLIEVAWILKSLTDAERAQLRSLLQRTSWMLTAMIRR